MTGDVKIIDKYFRKSAVIATIAQLEWQKYSKIKLSKIISLTTTKLVQSLARPTSRCILFDG
jgi:hypothetical protein